MGWLKLIRIASQEVLKYKIMYSGVDKPDESAHQNVTEVMHSQVHARVTRDKCPETHEERKFAPPHQVHGEECHAP